MSGPSAHLAYCTNVQYDGYGKPTMANPCKTSDHLAMHLSYTSVIVTSWLLRRHKKLFSIVNDYSANNHSQWRTGFSKNLGERLIACDVRGPGTARAPTVRPSTQSKSIRFLRRLKHHIILHERLFDCDLCGPGTASAPTARPSTR